MVKLYFTILKLKQAFKMKIDSKVDFTQKHPQDKNYCLITIPIERI